MPELATPEGAYPPGFFIGERGPALPDGLAAGYADVPTCVLGDVLGRNLGTSELRAYHPAGTPRMVGPALTVRVRPGDNLMIHKAILMGQPGDILVIDAGGHTGQAVIGGLMRQTLISKGFAGLVLDGALRDVEEWAEGGIAAFARGNCLRGPSKEGPGEINVPVSIAGCTVEPGDLVVGDADGVVAVAHRLLDGLLERCHAHLEAEAVILAQNKAGAASESRIDALLAARGVPLGGPRA